MSEYWTECICEAFEDAGLTATDEQIATVASWVDGAHEYYGMAHGHECIPNPLLEETARLTRELKVEREKVHCRNCNGRGRIISYGPSHSSDFDCWICHGEGRHAP